MTLVLTALRALRRSARGSLEHAVAAGVLGVAACFAVGSVGGNLVTNVVGMWCLGRAFAALASAIARDAPLARTARPARDERT